MAEADKAKASATSKKELEALEKLQKLIKEALKEEASLRTDAAAVEKEMDKEDD